MQGWLIYNAQDASENESYIEWFIEECNKQHIELKLLIREQLTVGIIDGKTTISYNGKPVEVPDFVVIRTIEPLLQYTFEALDIPTFNSFQVAQTTNHKSYTYMKISRLGIPMVPTYFATKRSLPLTPPLPFPFVVKGATGRGGKQVCFIADETDWLNVPKNIDSDDIIIQKADVQLGKDVRVFVIGKEIVASVLRENDHDFRANYKLGGKARLFTLTDGQKRTVQKIVDHFDFGLVGIDFLLSHDGELLFNEIEDVVGSRILSITSDINLLEKYVAFIKHRVAFRKQKITS